MSLLEIRDLRLVFDGFEGRAHVLDGIDLSVATGEAVGIVGETGCGKSVLARSVLRLNPSPPARVTGGAIHFDGIDILGMDGAALRRMRGRDIGMVFQDPVTYLNPVFTIGQQMAEVLRAHEPGLSRTALRTRSVALLESVRLPEAEALLSRYPHELSGGMRQRVLIAEALAGNPHLLIADEPTTALDVTIQRQVLALIADLVRRLGLTLILISHDLGVIGAVCRRIVVMYSGTIVEDAPAEALFRGPQHPYTRGLLAAIPDLNRPEHMPASIPGSIPDLRHPPSGCRFHPRCPLAMPVCAREKPPLVPAAAASQHLVACHAVAQSMVAAELGLTRAPV
ncbi:ABC transporter ATP-binding protein [Roseomonas sp. KE2513]|uniref:ABC transporter ATP-binding protein n=1 Tax=Roseomonas sp. KE2513 TaxID=2479202 RepID=UPI0018DFBFFA|nr:ABC transporter ATP-binding protein [Roseomonas sp. KE2513]MBI0534374.1 ABC transporter ATP-binding protein [Roseomonas sp. KE2513]